MNVKFKALHPEAFLPHYANPGDAGLDLYALDDGTIDRAHDFIEYKTGLAVEVPEGYVALLFPRSSISKYSLILSNCVGVLDSSYRGEITYRFRYTGYGEKLYKARERMGQMIILPYPQITPVWSENLSDSTRGEGGYGSTGA